MAATPDSVDRRSALKARSHQAILDAAAELMRQRRSTEFSVDELAARADVSRRTVFNHFDSLDDVATAVTGQLLKDVVDHMEARATSAAREDGTVLDDLAATASSGHLVPPMAYLIEILGDERQAARGAVLLQRAISLFTEQMSGAIARRHPDVDALQVELLVAAFSGGLLGIVNRWMTATDAVDTPESRRVWDELMPSLTAVLREPAG